MCLEGNHLIQNAINAYIDTQIDDGAVDIDRSPKAALTHYAFMIEKRRSMIPWHVPENDELNHILHRITTLLSKL